MLVNQKFIAERAGVSQKTVSLYFREPGKIAERTRNRIGTVVRQYHYLPNLAARSIRSRKFNRIACVVMQYGDRSKVIHPHLMAYLNGAASELSAAGYSLLWGSPPVMSTASQFLDLMSPRSLSILCR